MPAFGSFFAPPVLFDCGSPQGGVRCDIGKITACRNGIDGISVFCLGNDRMTFAFMLWIYTEIFV